MKVHIKRRHSGIGKPVEDGWHSTSTPTTMHFIPDMRSLQNNNYDLNYQRYLQAFSASPYSKKEEDISKKRDPLDEFLEFWLPTIQKMKEILEIKNFLNKLSSLSSPSQQHNITGLSQTPIIQPIILPVTTITPLQPTPQPVQPSQEKKGDY